MPGAGRWYEVPGAGAGAGQSQPAPRVPGAGMKCRVPVSVPVRFCQEGNQHPAPAIRGMLESQNCQH